MRPVRLLSIVLASILILAIPSLATPQLGAAAQTGNPVETRVAALETAVANLETTNAALATRVAALEALVTGSATLTATPGAPLPTPVVLPTATQTAAAATANRDANLRAGPDTSFAVIGSVDAGDVLAIDGRDGDGAWYRVQLDSGLVGWIAAFLVANAPAGAPAVATPAAVEAPADTATTEDAAPTATPLPAEQPSAGDRLDVVFINPHYNCGRGDNDINDFYRYFQIDFFVTNTSDQIVEAPWSPSSWIVTDGANERAVTEMLMWCYRTGCPEQPDIPPGGSEGWTWVTGRLALHEWVKAVVWEYNGQTYRQEFENNALNRAEWNYKQCGG